MGDSAVDHCSSFALEQSLQKSLSAIHRTPFSGSHNIISQKRDGCGESIPSKNSLRDNQRCSLPATKPIRSKSSLHVCDNQRCSLPITMPSPTSSRNVITPSGDEALSLPFPRENSTEQPQRETSRDHFTKKFQRRYAHKTSAERRSVLFVPSPSSSVQNDKQHTVEVEEEQLNTGFRKDYYIGETVRSPSHMITEPNSAVNSLEKHDCAFVKCSDGSTPK